MTDLDLGPGVLNVSNVIRGDDKSITLTIKEDGVAVVLPTTGWKAQVRAKATTAANVDQYPVLMEFDIDASQAGSGIIVLSWDGAAIDALPKKAYWDLQNEDPAVRTYVAGIVTPFDQVTR